MVEKFHAVATNEFSSFRLRDSAEGGGWRVRERERGTKFSCLCSNVAVNFLVMSTKITTGIREENLRDPRYPVHQIADQLLPYLQVLVDQFHPERVVLFGSYAHGNPNKHSDVDLLVVKPINETRIKDKVAIRSAWWPLLRQGVQFSFDLKLANPDECTQFEKDSNSIYGDILLNGIDLV